MLRYIQNTKVLRSDMDVIDFLQNLSEIPWFDTTAIANAYKIDYKEEKKETLI